jgi:formylglycine-generating enzyme required for sulfatase activity
MKYEFTNQQYTDFLNAVATNADTYSLYNSNMGSDARGGIMQTGTSGSYSYATKADMALKPVNYVSWFDAARVAKWLDNGATTNVLSTESGTYELLNGQTTGIAPARVGGQYWIPTEDQWYKAAYYVGGSSNAGYWDYATQSNTPPTSVAATSTGDGIHSGPNFANYNRDADWNGQDGNVTTRRTNGGPSAYGTFDMSGNVTEWNDLDGTASLLKGLRGGSWDDTDVTNLSSSFRDAQLASLETATIGFRLATVPEIDPATGSSALTLIGGVLAMLDQRRRRGTVSTTLTA